IIHLQMCLVKLRWVPNVLLQLKTIVPLIQLNQGTAHPATLQLAAIVDFHACLTTRQTALLVNLNLAVQL
ncbi:MAG: hypothetical protein ACK55Z_32980, partial [bacterium]